MRLILVSLLIRQSSVKGFICINILWKSIKLSQQRIYFTIENCDYTESTTKYTNHLTDTKSKVKHIHFYFFKQIKHFTGCEIPVACLPSRSTQCCSKAWLCSWRELGFSVLTNWISSSLNSSSLASSGVMNNKTRDKNIYTVYCFL